MAKSAFINDGFTREGYIAETEFYPACRFTYRPCTITERQSCRDKIHRETQLQGIDAGEKVVHRWIAERVLKWDLLDQGNHVVPITAANVGCLEPQFHTRLFGILMNEQLCDRDPKTDEAPANELDAVKN